MKLRPSKTFKTVTKCSFCHSDDGELESCDACGTLTHPECRKEHGRCPTLGCVKPVRAESLYRGRAFDRREGLYDTEAWPTTIAYSAQTPAMFQNYTNFAHTAQWPMATTMASGPYYIQNHLDGILTRPLREFDEPTEPDPMTQHNEQF